MKSVTRRTGLSPHVIRVWEKRYGAVIPQRTATNRRLYSDEDIDRLCLLSQAIQAGDSIGQIARLSLEQLTDLVAKATTSATPPSPKADQHVQRFDVQTYLFTCLAAVERLDPRALETALIRASVGLSQPILLDGLIAPLMETIGQRWHAGTLRVAHEHLASAVIRTFLGHLRGTIAVPETAPNLVVTTLAGQFHEIGALMAACLTAADGWHVTYLGPNLPAEEIAAAAQIPRTMAIALSIIYPEDDPHVHFELQKLYKALPPDITLFVGGRGATGYRDTLEHIGAIYLPTIAGLRTHLAVLRSQPPPA